MQLAGEIGNAEFDLIMQPEMAGFRLHMLVTAAGEQDGRVGVTRDLPPQSSFFGFFTSTPKETREWSIEEVLEMGVDVNQTHYRETGFMPLMSAAKSGSGRNVELLLAREANVNAQDISGYTALMHAVVGENTETVRAILDSNLDVDVNLCCNNTGSQHINALTIAQARNLTDIVLMLRERGALEGRNVVPVAAVVRLAEVPLATAIVAEVAAVAPTNQQNNQR